MAKIIGLKYSACPDCRVALEAVYDANGACTDIEVCPKCGLQPGNKTACIDVQRRCPECHKNAYGVGNSVFQCDSCTWHGFTPEKVVTFKNESPFAEFCGVAHGT